MKNYTKYFQTGFFKQLEFLILALFGILINSSSAQTILFNNGAQVYAGPTAIIQVNGGFQNDGASGTTPVFENNGTMTISNSVSSLGSVFLKNGSELKGNGTYFVEQDWTNDALFTAGTSTVNFNGNLQELITSTNGTATTFNNLVLSGTGVGIDKKKTLQNVSASVGTNGTLTINDRELETLTNTMFVLNPSTTCVSNNTTVGSEGFVSSSVGGTFSRATAASSSYVFPTGSSVGTTRYRPVQISPASAAANTYTARLGNNIATADGFTTTALDSTMCIVNNLYYHQITRPAGTDNAGIAVFYDQPADGSWDGMAQWNTPTAALWNNMGTVTATSGTPFNDVLKVGWTDFSNSPYVLSRQKPQMPGLPSTLSVCPNSPDNIFIATGTGSTFTWSSPAGTTITSGQGTSSVSIDWNSITGGPVTVSTTNALGCASNLSTCLVSISTPTVAEFQSTANGLIYALADLTTGSANEWTWDFGDGSSTSGTPSPSHTYTSEGLHTICLTTNNSAGCSDSICHEIDVKEIVNIPNIFTPDGDGINDVFYIKNSGFEKYKIEIFDRWGIKIFESEAASIRWDGRSSAGVESTDGTYYYILVASSITSKDYSTTGFVQLLRTK